MTHLTALVPEPLKVNVAPPGETIHDRLKRLKLTRRSQRNASRIKNANVASHALRILLNNDAGLHLLPTPGNPDTRVVVAVAYGHISIGQRACRISHFHAAVPKARQ